MDYSSGGTLSRREILRAGSLGVGGVTLAQLLEARTQTADSNARADSCIILFLNGGPSHLDMWDMKPDGVPEVRGKFQPISTSVPGIEVCHLLPRLAKLAHHTTLVRSMHHSVNNSHAAAVYCALTGHDRGEQGGGARPSDSPPPGAVVAKLRPSSKTPISYVTLPYKTKEGPGGPVQPGFLAGYIGPTYDPFWILEDPNTPSFRVPNLTLPTGFSPDRMVARGDLLSRFDKTFRHTQRSAVFNALDDYQRRAFQLLTSSAARRAFEVKREPAKLRDSYGRNIYGQSVLLARRLIEAGTRVVTVSWAPDANSTWDTHSKNFQKLESSLLPQFDAACSSLIEDLWVRGMLDRTLVAVIGDFGRTPTINGNGGRDHWNSCYTVMLAGGGIKRGFVFGASDNWGAVPTRDPVTPGDIVATIYSLLGIDPYTTLYDNLQRPFQIAANGRMIPQLLA